MLMRDWGMGKIAAGGFWPASVSRISSAVDSTFHNCPEADSNRG
jgi:hypothetical protein